MKNKEPQVHVATFLTITGSDANLVFETFEWTNENHKSDIVQVLDTFEVYTKPRTNVYRLKDIASIFASKKQTNRSRKILLHLDN